MANLRKRREENAPGAFYVDSSCIDCDQCRQIAPDVFRAEGEASVVHRQPDGPEQVHLAEMALVTCPTASIGLQEKRDLRAAVEAFPQRIENGVYFCGFASEASFGGSSYLVVRPEGNVLVDSPRFTAPLVRRIEAMGGLRWMFLSHQDDVADHRKFRERFGCERIMHEADAGFPVERIIQGREPVFLDDGLTVLPTPGHTAGHLALLYQDRYLFTGDHLWWDPEERRLDASREYCWYSWAEQRNSMERLRGWSFEWVLPGHGARVHVPAEQMGRHLEDLIKRMA